MEAARVAFASGFGPMLFVPRCDTWRNVIGNDVGLSVYSLTIAQRNKEGAVLKNISAPYYS